MPYYFIDNDGKSVRSEPCLCEPEVITTSILLSEEGSLNTAATYLRDYMTEFRNSNFWAYTMDGDESGNYIDDGGNDMYDNGNFTTPWLRSGDRYDIDSTSTEDYPYAIAYGTTTQSVIDTDFNYVSLGWIFEEDTGDPQIDQSRHPLIVLGYRSSGPVGWQIGGNLGSDGGGDVSSGYLYQNQTVNGFTVYAGYRQVYNAGDPTVCNLIILLGHNAWSSIFDTVTLNINEGDSDGARYNQISMYSGESSANILAIHILLSRTSGSDPELISDSELQTIVSNITN
jgi:hypothetical protein